MSIQPFAEQGHYTPIHDSIFDVVMPKCPPNAWKVLCYIIRKTRGWQKEQDSLPYRQIKEGAGINSDTTVSKALNWLVANELIVANAKSTEHGRWQATSYGLNRSYVLDYGSEPTPENVNGPTPETGSESTPETEVGPTPETGDLNNHRVRQEPESNKQEIAETGSAGQKMGNTRQRPTDPTKGNYYVDMLTNGLDAARASYADRMKGKFAKAVKARLDEGVGPETLVPATARMIERIPDWPDMELADALGDLRRGKQTKPEPPRIRSQELTSADVSERGRKTSRDAANVVEKYRRQIEEMSL